MRTNNEANTEKLLRMRVVVGYALLIGLVEIFAPDSVMAWARWVFLAIGVIVTAWILWRRHIVRGATNQK